MMRGAVDVTDTEHAQVVLEDSCQVALKATACSTPSLIEAAVMSGLRSVARTKREKSSRNERLQGTSEATSDTSVSATHVEAAADR
jgi:hypothetical protein